MKITLTEQVELFEELLRRTRCLTLMSPEREVEVALESGPEAAVLFRLTTQTSTITKGVVILCGGAVPGVRVHYYAHGDTGVLPGKTHYNGAPAKDFVRTFWPGLENYLRN